MKLKKICMLLLAGLGIAPMVQAQSFDKLWKQVEQAEQKSLPETVIKLTEEIYQKGMKEKNSPQMLKSYLWKMKYREMLTPDSLYSEFTNLEQWAKTAEKPMDRAILHSLLAEKYADYASSNRWQLRRRTLVVDEAPSADMREWTANMFVDKVKDNIRQSLSDSTLLLSTSARTYTPFVILGDASEYYKHDMYHLLVSRAIVALNQIEGMLNDVPQEESPSIKDEIMLLYQNMISAFEAQGYKEGTLLTKLDYLEAKYQNNETIQPFRGVMKENYVWNLSQDEYVIALNQLISEYQSYDVCAEAYLAKALYAVQKNALTDAVQACDDAISLYPRYSRINALKDQKDEIIAPNLNFSATSAAYPGKEIKLNISYKNLNGFTLRLIQDKKTVKEQHFALLPTKDYRSQDTIYTFIAPEIGKYTMEVVADGEKVKKDKDKDNVEKQFNVTNFQVLSCSLPDKQYEIVTLDALTGHPIANAAVTLYNGDKKPIQELTGDANGKITFTWKSDYRYVNATKGADTAMPLQNIYSGSYGYYGDEQKRSNFVTLLTDRSLYRPGQTVYIKGIAYEQQSDTANVIANKEFTVSLMDVNNQEVGQKKVRTNEFGSFTADFALPSVCLNGMFRVQTTGGSTQIRVEEYKRPTFDITFDKQKGSYKLGDKVEAKGKVQTFSGVLLQDLPVTYTVSRSAYSFWRFSEYTRLASGEVTLDANGEFTIPFTLEESAAYKNNDHVYYRYQVEATVTNVAGETQSSTYSISAGTRSLVLQAELDNKICKDKPATVTFKVQNLDSQPIEVTGTYQLFRAKDKEMKQLEEAPAATGTFTSNKEMSIDWSKIPSGAYVLKASVKDDQGREVTADAQTVLFSLNDKRPAVETDMWLYNASDKFDAEHPAKIYFGTSRKDAYVFMNVFSGDKLLESRVLTLSDAIENFTYPYKESYGTGLLITFCMVKDGEVYQEQVSLLKSLADKTLTMKWDVFRDKLRPGQKEEWKLTIKTPQGTFADAEMLATMYDSSLDKIWTRPQNFKLYYNRILPYSNWMGGYYDYNSYYYNGERTDLKVPSLVYDYFISVYGSGVDLSNPINVGYGRYGTRGLIGSAAGVMLEESTVVRSTMSKRSNVAVADVAPMTKVQQLSKKDSSADGETLSEAPANLRTNLAETAFFYPQLRTNEKGEVSFSFTMPESLTSWNFRGYSHTKNMMMGTLDGKATTSKEFMLTPNLPRFVRVGDNTSIAASIANMTGKAQAGNVTMTLFDPITEKVISTQKQKFSVEAGKTIGVNFAFTVSDNYDILGCRLIADGGAFSDGEQQLLPVLSNKQHLVETVAMPIRGDQTRTFALDSLFNRHSPSATDRKLTIEFTGNPAWYAIQALPSLSLPTDNNALSWATAYYANSLASFIMNSQPRIKAVFDSWKLQGGTKETFMSNLQKNQEVKNIILSESPWVLEAQTEEQQKERIATLFDLNNIQANNISALTRLQELQGSNGAWSWYKGMNGSQYVTSYIAILNARMQMITNNKLDGSALAMQNRAINYLHKEALEEYNNILKGQKSGVKYQGVSSSALQYLYLIAISNASVPSDNKAAYNYYLSKLSDMLTTASMDQKAIIAIVLDKADRTKEAQEFIASLKEHLTKTDEQGMFFAFNENPYTWGTSKMQAQVDVMEALNVVGDNDETVEEMKLWLLKQKQTQQWNSPVSTADAVYALLMNGTNLLDDQANVKITIANQVLETSASSKSSVPGLGYIKRSFTEKNVVDARKVVVEKKDQGIAWGAAYAEFDSPISDVKQLGGELNVKKQLYVERTVNNTPQLQPITDKTILKVGDKVVSRLSIKVDRTMDFVQLKDQRGACFEPIDAVSGYSISNGIGFYIDVKDASTNYFFDHLSNGVYILENSYRVARTGTYETGLAIMQCAYAPEYASHSSSMTVEIK